jgi:hypothetical protein
MVHVALSEFVFSTSQVVASIAEGWASTILAGQQTSSRAAAQLQVVNFSEISAEDAGPVANFVTPDRQLVDAVIHVEVIVGSVFANFGDEVASVRFIARDQHGNEVSVQVDAPTLSTWGNGDARPGHSYDADIPTTGLTDGDRNTMQAEITDHVSNIRVSAPNGSVRANPIAFTDQVYLLDTNGTFGKAYAYVEPLSVRLAATRLCSVPATTTFAPEKAMTSSLPRLAPAVTSSMAAPGSTRSKPAPQMLQSMMQRWCPSKPSVPMAFSGSSWLAREPRIS